MTARTASLADVVDLFPERKHRRVARRTHAARRPTRRGGDRVVQPGAIQLARADVAHLLAHPCPLLAKWWMAWLRIGYTHLAHALGRAEVDVRPWKLLAAGNWTFTNSDRTYMLDGTFDFDTDSFKMGLATSASNLGAATTTYAGVTGEVANANGYTTGGIAVTFSLSGTTTVTADLSSDPVWTATGGSITARFAFIYEVSGNVVCYCLCDSTPADVTATDGNTLTVQINASGVFQLS